MYENCYIFFLQTRKMNCGNICPLRVRAQRESGLVKILQPCFPNIAKLKRCKSLKPIPPPIFIWVISDHFLRCIFLLSPSPPHQYRATEEVILLHVVLDNSKQLIELICSFVSFSQGLSVMIQCFSLTTN